VQSNLIAYLLIIGGAVLIISGVRNTTPGQTLKSLLQGELPSSKPSGPPVGGGTGGGEEDRSNVQAPTEYT